MKVIKRVGFYLVGFSIGLVFLAMIWKGKKAEFNYGPDARVLKNISTKELIYSQIALDYVANYQVDTSKVTEALKHGNVDFSSLDRDLDSCKIYTIQRALNDEEITLTVENCERIATIKSIRLE
jgi:hypothetical protein